MKTLTLRMPSTLYKRLTRAAKHRGQRKSAVARAALEELLNKELSVPPGSLLEAIQPWIGCVQGPGDLSTKPKYMEGFGQ